MLKSRLYQLDFGIQTFILAAFFCYCFTGHTPILSSLLIGMLALGLWQLISAASWGLLMAEFSRCQFFFMAVIGLAGMSILMNLPEYRDAEFLVWLGKLMAVLMMGFYYRKSYEDFQKTLPAFSH